MKINSTYRNFLLTAGIAGCIMFAGSGFAQQKTQDQGNSKKTITIHVTKEANGSTIVIDTTVITDGDFDADAYLEKKGVLNDTPEKTIRIDKDIIMRHPGSHDFIMHESEGNEPDTLIIDNDSVIIMSNILEMPAHHPLHPGMPFSGNFNMMEMFSHMEAPQIEAITKGMVEGMLESAGFDDVFPFGEMKQVVVKKKRHGKKVIISFEDREKSCCEHSHGKRNNERVMIIKNMDESRMPQNEERIIIQGNPTERVIIKKDSDESVPGGHQQKVIIIKEEKKK